MEIIGWTLILMISSHQWINLSQDAQQELLTKNLEPFFLKHDLCAKVHIKCFDDGVTIRVYV